MLETLAEMIAYLFGIGHLGLVRGPLAVALAVLLMMVLPENRGLRLGFALVVCGIGWWAAHVTDILLVDVIDAGPIVIDEFAAAALMMAIAMPKQWQGAAGLGIAFWFLDSVKPWPFYLVEAVPAASGIMLDDLAIGIPLGIGYAMLKRWFAVSERKQ